MISSLKIRTSSLLPVVAVAGYFVAFIIGIQFLVNLGVNTGVLPTKGLTLPFVSYGGNSLIVCCAMLALVLRCTLDKEPQRG